MSVGDAFDITARTYAVKLRELLPFYFAMLSVPAIGLTVWAVGVPIVGYLLSRAGVLAELSSVLEADAPIPIDPEPGSGGPFGQESEPPVDVEAVRSILLDVPPPVTGLFFLFLSSAVFLSILAFAIVAAGRLDAVYACLTDEPPVRSGVDGIFEHSSTFLSLYLLEAIVAVLSVPTLVLIPALPLVHAFFAFARSAAVVDDVGATGAISNAGSFVRRQPLTVLGYVTIAVVAVGALLFVNLLFSAVRAPQVSMLLSAFMVVPLFDIFRTVLYARGHPGTTVVRDRTPAGDRSPKRAPRDRDESPTFRPLDDTTPREGSGPTGTPHESPRDRAVGTEIVVPARPSAGSLTRLRRAVAVGWSELVSFTRGQRGLVALNALLFFTAVALGWQLTAPIGWLFEASIERRVGSLFPPGTMLNFFANNWAVSIRQALAGFAFGLPTIVSILQNGLIIGALVRFELAPTALVAFLLPHALLELPALWLSGALGLHLGRVGLGVARGRVDRATLTMELDRAIDVLVGLGVLFALAAIVEAFVSPYYWQPFVG